MRKKILKKTVELWPSNLSNSGESVKLETSPGQGTLYSCGPTRLKIRLRIENGDPRTEYAGALKKKV